MAFKKKYDYFDNFMLKASRYGEFNDPFDLVSGDYRASLSKPERDEFLDAMKHLSDPDFHIENYFDVAAGVRASIAVICFTESYNNLLMWAHYAKNHTGICVGYDYNCKFFHHKYTDNVGKIRKVIYSKERPKYYDPSELVNGTDHWFNKSQEWKYEKEHRILLPIVGKLFSDDCDQNLQPPFLFSIEPKYIQKVILGCRMNEDDKKYIHKMLSPYGNIRIIEATPDPAHYKLNFSIYEPNNSDRSNIVYNLGMDI